MLLAGWTSTSLVDILDMETDEFWAWFSEAQNVQNEIPKVVSK